MARAGCPGPSGGGQHQWVVQLCSGPVGGRDEVAGLLRLQAAPEERRWEEGRGRDGQGLPGRAEAGCGESPPCGSVCMNMCLYEHVLASRMRPARRGRRALSSDPGFQADRDAPPHVRAARCGPGDPRPRRDRALPIAFPERLTQVPPGAQACFPSLF